MRYFIYIIGGLIAFSILATTLVLKSEQAEQKIVKKNDMGLSLSVMPKTATPGDTFWFVLSVINKSKDTIEIVLPTPLPAKFTVYRDERPIWNSDYGMMFAQVLTSFIIPPGDSIPLKAFWLGKNNQAKFQPLGKYVVEGCLLGIHKCIRDSLWLVD